MDHGPCMGQGTQGPGPSPPTSPINLRDFFRVEDDFDTTAYDSDQGTHEAAAAAASRPAATPADGMAAAAAAAEVGAGASPGSHCEWNQCNQLGTFPSNYLL